MSWQDDVRRANDALDWIEARQGPLPPTNYARIETTVQQVRAMASEQQASGAATITIEREHVAALLAAAEAWHDHVTAHPLIVCEQSAAIWRLGQAITETGRVMQQMDD